MMKDPIPDISDDNWIIAPDDGRLEPVDMQAGVPGWLEELERTLISGADFWSSALRVSQSIAHNDDRSENALTDIVHRCLHLGISIGSLGTGIPLIEVDIAKGLGVSRTPVREALQRLDSDGLLSRRRRGWEVRRLDKVRLREAYELRMALESFATAQAAIRATEDDIHDIVRANEARETVTHGDILARLTSNRDFHNRIFMASNNSRLVAMIRRHTQYYFSYKFAHLVTPEESALFQSQHNDITDAIRLKNPSMAEKAMRAHIASTYKIYKRFYVLL